MMLMLSRKDLQTSLIQLRLIAQATATKQSALLKNDEKVVTRIFIGCIKSAGSL